MQFQFCYLNRVNRVSSPDFGRQPLPPCLKTGWRVPTQTDSSKQLALPLASLLFLQHIDLHFSAHGHPPVPLGAKAGAEPGDVAATWDHCPSEA